MRLFKSNVVDTVMTRFKVPDDVPIEAKMVTNAIASAQHQVEQQHFEIRKNVLKYDEVLNRQRQVIYAERRRVLEADLHEQVRHMLDDVTERLRRGGDVRRVPRGVGSRRALDGPAHALPDLVLRRGGRGARRRRSLRSDP